jgi:hypothetical protein
VERTINRLKGWRRVATRYEKREANYLVMVTIAAVVLLWLLSHSRSGAGRTAEPFWSQPSPGGTGSPGATYRHRHPWNLQLQTAGSYAAFNKSVGSLPSRPAPPTGGSDCSTMPAGIPMRSATTVRCPSIRCYPNAPKSEANDLARRDPNQAWPDSQPPPTT